MSDDQSGPYSPSNAHGDSSSRAITSNPSALARPSDGDSVPEFGDRPPRASTLGEHFNRPLRRHVWSAKKQWTRRQLDREREEYFDTRVTGRAESWSAIRMAVETMESDLSTAQTILDAAGITVPTGDVVNGVYDEVGNYYQIPEHCISDPVNLTSTPKASVSSHDVLSDMDEEEMERRREEKGKGVVHAAETYRVRARLSDRGGPDVTIALGKQQPVRVLVRKLQEETEILGRNQIRVAYMGKILKEGETLSAQGWQEGHVVNALVFP
ncbi:MAG: hypothetical protein M1837_005737 [Sclerophora amabilis]|nr:MAG: hypothetical protein M1837_005737 [Sclerophora amabilis]